MQFKSLFKINALRSDVHQTLKEYFSEYLRPDMEVYDIGCGSKPFSPFLSGKVKSYIGVDIEDGFYDSSHIDIIGTAYNVPVESGIADAVISSQVLEHLDRPRAALEEINRLLKTDGLLFLSLPFLYPLHAQPHDYGRYTYFMVKQMLEEQRFEIINYRALGGFWYVSSLNFSLYIKMLDRGFLKKTGIVKAFSWFVQWLFYLVHLLEGAILKRAGKDTEYRQIWTVNHVLVARKKAGN